MSYADTILSLRERLSGVAQQIASLADKRKGYSLAATEGDERARKQIGDVDFETDALLKEQQTVASAIETAEALIKQQELEAQAAQQREREAEAHRHAQAVVALNTELDAILKELRGALERRAEALRGLGNSGVVDPNLIMRLASKSGPSAAAAHAGLGKFLALEMVPVPAMRPLADTNGLLAGIGRPASPSLRPRASRSGTR